MKGIDLRPYCGDWKRYDIDKPWLHNGKVYATDGAILLEVDPGSYSGKLGDGSHPDVDTIFAKYPKSVDEWMPVPKVDGPPENCDNICWEYDDDDEIFVCDEAEELIRIGVEDFKRRYIWHVMQLPSVECCLTNCNVSEICERYENHKQRWLAIRFEGGRGLLMPMTKED